MISAMKNSAMKNFHLPLPETLYAELRTEAERSNLPTTTLARQALEQWLKEKRRSALRRAIEAYAAETAGLQFDLDETLENAAVETMLADEGSD
jgi:predicted transcriptional regulator